VGQPPCGLHPGQTRPSARSEYSISAGSQNILPQLLMLLVDHGLSEVKCCNRAFTLIHFQLLSCDLWVGLAARMDVNVQTQGSTSSLRFVKILLNSS